MNGYKMLFAVAIIFPAAAAAKPFAAASKNCLSPLEQTETV